MSEEEALQLVRQFLRAESNDQVTELMGQNLHRLDGVFFSAAEASAEQLAREGKVAIAQTMRDLAAQLLRMKTLI